jgi:hypothetical protein
LKPSPTTASRALGLRARSAAECTVPQTKEEFAMNALKWFSRIPKRSEAGGSGRAHSRLEVECLEDRVVPTTHLGDLVLGPTDHLDVEVTREATNPAHRLNVVGSVEINNAALNVVSLGKEAKPGDRFVIIDNDGTDPVLGAFAGLPEGSVITMPGGAKLQISYEGGDGNDVELTRLHAIPQFQNRSVTSSVTEGSVATLSGTIVSPDPQQKFILEVSWGDSTPVEIFEFAPGQPTDVSVTHPYAENGQYQISLFWHYPNEPGNTATLFTSVVNVAPVVNAGPDVTLLPGGTLQRTFTFTDPGPDTHTATVDYGDGSGIQAVTPDKTGKWSLDHVYLRPGVYHVTVAVIDDDGGVGVDTFTVTVL